MKLTKKDFAEFVKANVPASEVRSAGYSASGVPKLTKPYTKILAGIDAGERVLNQSTFGEETLEKHVCGTPMCIAGSLVQLAGADGWKLKSELGWIDAASLLHYEAHPNLPHANFGNVGNEASMIYLRLMAKLESKLDATAKIEAAIAKAVQP